MIQKCICGIYQCINHTTITCLTKRELGITMQDDELNKYIEEECDFKYIGSNFFAIIFRELSTSNKIKHVQCHQLTCATMPCTNTKPLIVTVA